MMQSVTRHRKLVIEKTYDIVQEIIFALPLVFLFCHFITWVAKLGPLVHDGHKTAPCLNHPMLGLFTPDAIMKGISYLNLQYCLLPFTFLSSLVSILVYLTVDVTPEQVIDKTTKHLVSGLWLDALFSIHDESATDASLKTTCRMMGNLSVPDTLYTILLEGTIREFRYQRELMPSYGINNYSTTSNSTNFQCGPAPLGTCHFVRSGTALWN
jgi:hypothetical protein